MRWRDARTDPPTPFRNGKPYLIVARWYRAQGIWSATEMTPNQLADRQRIDNDYEWLDEDDTPDYIEIIRCLQHFVQMHGSGLLPNRFTYEDAVKALRKLQADDPTI